MLPSRNTILKVPSALTIMNNLITLHVYKERKDAIDFRVKIVVQSSKHI